MRRNKVHARIRPPSRTLVQIGAAGEAEGKLTQGLILAAPIIAHAVAVFAVPFQPQWWEVSHLVAAFADIPRFGDKLGLADDWILLNNVEESRKPVDVVQA